MIEMIFFKKKYLGKFISFRPSTTRKTTTTTTTTTPPPALAPKWAPMNTETFGQWIGDVQHKYPTKYEHIMPSFDVPIGIKGKDKLNCLEWSFNYL